MNAFHVLGALFALWAVTVTVLGLTRENFLRTRGQARIAGGISVVLAIAAISSAIITGANEANKHGEAEAKAGGGEAKPGGPELALAADPSQLKFDKSELSAKPGKVTISMKNPSPSQHDVSIEGGGVDKKGKIVGQGGTSTVEADLKAGEYTFYCSVDAHRQAGMEGKLTVR
jgi:plastocyanin